MTRRLPCKVGLGPLALLALAACGGQGPSTAVPTEPLQVNGAQFIPGTLPGTPLADDAGTGNPLSVVGINQQPRPFFAGAMGQPISGLVTSDATSVGIEFADMGTGYWVVVVGGPDPANPGDSSFSFTANFNPTDPPGHHQLRFVAIDANGRAGMQDESTICILPSIPDNLHTCVPSKAPPAAVISLSWDTNFDLDLHVLVPGGTDLGPKTPALAVDAGTAPAFDRDSLQGCVADGTRQEDLVFQDPPPPGDYSFRVDPFAACGQAASHFTLTAYVAKPLDVCHTCRSNPSATNCSGCQLSAVFSAKGELLGSQATGGASAGLYVGRQTF